MIQKGFLIKFLIQYAAFFYSGASENPRPPVGHHMQFISQRQNTHDIAIQEQISDLPLAVAIINQEMTAISQAEDIPGLEKLC